MFWLINKKNNFSVTHTYLGAIFTISKFWKLILLVSQGSHRLEKYLNIQGCLKKSLKIQSALKSTGKSLKALKRPLIFTIYCRI